MILRYINFRYLSIYLSSRSTYIARIARSSLRWHSFLVAVDDDDDDTCIICSRQDFMFQSWSYHLFNVLNFKVGGSRVNHSWYGLSRNAVTNLVSLIWTFSNALISFLPARRYASAGNSDRNVSLRLSVRPSVRQSRAGIVSKRRKLAGWFLHHLVAPRL